MFWIIVFFGILVFFPRFVFGALLVLFAGLAVGGWMLHNFLSAAGVG